jgi:hypothetical protein
MREIARVSAILGIVCAAALMLIAAPARAAVPVWSMNATSCVPDADTITFDRYVTNKGIVAHRKRNVDLIQLACDVNNPPIQGTQWFLFVTYRDSTGTAATANVLARLIRVSRTTGAQTVVATFNSNDSGVVTMGQGSVGFTHAFDFANNYYYVLLALDRSSFSETVQVVGAAIEPFIP